MTSNYTFIYDGECPFCNHFAELLEIKSKINNIKILDGRKNLTLIKSLLDKGYDLDKGAILLKDEEIFHGADAINTICKQINNPDISINAKCPPIIPPFNLSRFDLNTLESNKSKLLEGLFICLQIVLIASAP